MEITSYLPEPKHGNKSLIGVKYEGIKRKNQIYETSKNCYEYSSVRPYSFCCL